MTNEELIREMNNRKIDGVTLARCVGISPSMISKVKHGVRRFSDVTEHQVLKVLKNTPVRES